MTARWHVEPIGMDDAARAIGVCRRLLSDILARHPHYETRGRTGPERVAECPDYDAKTDDEIAAAKERMRQHMDRFVKAMPILNAIRATMVDGKVARDVVDCPFCGTAKALHVSVAIGYNNHMHAKCKECGEGFME